MDIAKAIDVYNHLYGVADPKIFHITAYRAIDYGIQFTISFQDTSGLLRIYQNAKGILRIDTSQIKSAQILDLISTLLPIQNASIPHPFSSTEIALASRDTKGYPMIGTDESGKGDYFGPLVIGSAMVDAESEKRLIVAGVQDSKKISDNSIHRIAQTIKSILTNKKYSVVVIGPQKYNELHKKMKNLNKVLAWGHARAIENILEHEPCERAIADQFGDESFIKKALLEQGRRIHLIQMPKAEQYIAVAAASVLARDSFLMRISDMRKELGFPVPKGASPDVEDAARLIIRKFGTQALAKYAKLHFKTTEKLNADIN